MLASLSPFVVLCLESLGMFAVTYLCGVVPLFLSLSKTKLRILEVLGAGLLVGASMTVVLPEGVSALFTSGDGHGHDHEHAHTDLHTRSVQYLHMSLRQAEAPRRGRAREFDPESATGIAILSGFLVMFLIDQIAAPGSHVHSDQSSSDRDRESGAQAHASHRYVASHRPETLRLTRASSLNYPAAASAPGGVNGVVSPRIAAPQSPALYDRSENSPEGLPEDHDHVDHSTVSLLRADGSGPRSSSPSHGTRARKGSNAGSIGRAGHGINHNRGIRTAIASIAGLIIHAAADGIAMGASAGSGNEGLKIIVLFAIMIHKAPAAFGLCALLMGQRLHKSVIRRAIAIFSLATPVGAILSYLFLALILPSAPGGGVEGGIEPHHIGGALTFSAGTFMYVAMHAVNELASAAADVDGEAAASGPDGTHPHHRDHHHSHHAHAARHNSAVEGASATGDGATGRGQQPRQILGRTGRVAVFVLGTMLPKTLQSLVGHGH